MDIVTYTVTDDAFKVNKTLGTGTTYTNAVMKDPTDTVHPVLTLQTSANLSGINYVYIERYGRYYFAETPIAVKNNVWEIHCKSDPLMSFKTSLLELKGTVTRSESLYNFYINDGQFKALAYRNIVTKSFPQAVANDSCILMTVG